jgi:hypothetical protein
MEAPALKVFLDAHEQSLLDVLVQVHGDEDVARNLTEHAANISKIAEAAHSAGKDRTVQGLKVDTVRFLSPKSYNASDIQ